MNIAVTGSKGYVGSALCAELLRSSKYIVTGVTRENYREMQERDFDIVVNCAMPSGKFWAKNNPEKDFIETVEKTANLLYKWKFKKFVQISTVSARCQLDTIYGRHKAAAENLIDKKNNLIVRLGAVYSKEVSKGVIKDMLEGKKVFVDGRSRYSFISLQFCIDWVISNLDKNGTVELGGKNAISLEGVASHLEKNIEFEGSLSHLDILDSGENLPEASELLKDIYNWS